MEWYWILLISIASLFALILVILFVLAVIGFNTAFSRDDPHPFDQIDLKGTKYEGFEDLILPAFQYMRPIQYENCWIESFDGLKLHAKYYKGKTDKLVLMVHGYHADPLNNFAIVGRRFLEDGYSLLMIDQRAHSISEGKWTTFGVHESKDVLRWMEYIDSTIKPSMMIAYGVSLGCATLELASSSKMPESLKCLILDCGYASPLDQMKKSFAKKLGLLGEVVVQMFFPIVCPMIGRFNILKKCYKELEKASVPCFFIHGGRDSMVPLEEGEKSYNHCNARKEKAFFPDSEHNSCFMMHEDEIVSKLNAFLD